MPSSKRIVVLASDEEYEQLREDAFKARKSMTALLRDAYFRESTRAVAKKQRDGFASEVERSPQALAAKYGLATGDELAKSCRCWRARRLNEQQRERSGGHHDENCPMWELEAAS